ncbi:DUF389 domain-containing protein [Phenylobacterium montanum]|uniref:DUF389 domain-containing protein n=1 Tax=Phenylobacterium montanum TaxID=2823693 RepID=A0A975IW50_9CAUL|nr:DUF389 domain-containing protein [Caulobacter sp. S6]QUD89508.1 DUF389 domain-containing protein [Caulobacter sp. S6]
MPIETPEPILDSHGADGVWRRLDLIRYWRDSVVAAVDHQKTLAQVNAESGWSPRYLFMILMSAGIAVLGLLVSSPAVVIGAMLISPLMNPILGLGFSLAVFDFGEARRSLTALAMGSLAAVAFTGLIVLASPLKEVTSEILARTRPNLFDLMIALFAALAGAFAVIKGQGATIVGVAIATALMPPLAVVGYGLATWNPPILFGALALFVTNFVTIAFSATVTARFYGFGHALSRHQTRLQTAVLALVFVALAIPLGLSLKQIADEVEANAQIRSVLTRQFGPTSRVTQLTVDFDARPVAVRAVVIAPRVKSRSNAVLQADLEKALGRPINLQADQLLIDQNSRGVQAQLNELQQAEAEAGERRQSSDRVAKLVAVAAGVGQGEVVLDRDDRQVTAKAKALPGADLETYRKLEQRIAASAPGWTIAIAPPFGPLPLIRFANGSDTLDDNGQEAVLTSAWAANRWNIPELGVPGLPQTGHASERPKLAERRALAIAAILKAQAIQATGERPSGRTFRLSTSTPRPAR